MGLWFSGAAGRKITRLAVLYSFIITIFFLIVTINLGWLRTWFPATPQLFIIFVNPATLLTVLYSILSIYVLRRTGSTRLAAIALFTCVLIGYIIFTLVAVNFRGPNWEFYWLKSMWPSGI